MAHHHEQKVPRPMIVAIGSLLVASLAIATYGRLTRAPSESQLTQQDAEFIELRFADAADGSVIVRRADSNEEVARFGPGEGGFVRGVMRGMFRTRMQERVPREAPFRLSRQLDGRFSLSDPSTGRVVELRSFGRTNYEVFAGLLEPAAAPEEDS